MCGIDNNNYPMSPAINFTATVYVVTAVAVKL